MADADAVETDSDNEDMLNSEETFSRDVTPEPPAMCYGRVGLPEKSMSVDANVAAHKARTDLVKLQETACRGRSIIVSLGEDEMGDLEQALPGEEIVDDEDTSTCPTITLTVTVDMGSFDAVPGHAAQLVHSVVDIHSALGRDAERAPGLTLQDDDRAERGVPAAASGREEGSLAAGAHVSAHRFGGRNLEPRQLCVMVSSSAALVAVLVTGAFAAFSEKDTLAATFGF
eukprot:TRINITY_DN38112_c0_g1_i1.p1 TRINITY_DN38112_c0_g1~~TRINITY_DN38112_c0_g1_i1.p1  ORF type:complete len:259 (-),score=55.79 TRINITY_DN38112_c0_g1_i1:37-723(-)